MVHFEVIFPLIKKLRGWSQKVTLIKVKSHAGCFFNEMADERAEKGRLSEAVQIYQGPNKYGTFQLCIKASLRAQVAEDKLTAPSPVMKPPISRSCARLLRLLVLTSYKHSNSEILCSLRMF